MKHLKGRKLATITSDRIDWLQAEATPEGETASGLPKFSMVAYTGGAMTVRGWDAPVVVDLAGLQWTAKARPILKDHSASLVVGHTTAIRVVGGDLVDDAALSGEDLAVVREEIGALHAGATGFCADEEGPVGVLEANLGGIGEDHVLQERKGAVVELHGDAFESFHGFFEGDFDELKHDRLVGTEHRPGGDAEEEGVGDLAGGTGYGDSDGCFHKRE